VKLSPTQKRVLVEMANGRDFYRSGRSYCLKGPNYEDKLELVREATLWALLKHPGHIERDAEQSDFWHTFYRLTELGKDAAK